MGASSSRAGDSSQVSDASATFQAPASHAEATSRSLSTDQPQQQHTQKHSQPHDPQQITESTPPPAESESVTPIFYSGIADTSTTAAAAAGLYHVAEPEAAAASEQAAPSTAELLPSASSFNRAIEEAVLEPIDTHLDNRSAEAGTGATTASPATPAPAAVTEAATAAPGDPMVLQEQLLAAVSVSQTQTCDQQQQAPQDIATNAPNSTRPSNAPTITAAAAGGSNSTDSDWIMIQGAAGRTAPASQGGSTVAVQMTGAGHDGDVVEAPGSSSAGAPGGTSAAAPTAAVEGLMRGVDSYKAPEDLLQAPASGTVVIAGRPLAAGEVPDQSTIRLSDYQEQA